MSDIQAGPGHDGNRSGSNRKSFEHELTQEERQIYEWQMWTRGMGESGQKRLKSSRVLISRIGGVGGLVAYELAAAGIGTLVLAHGGAIKHSDLNRQILMTHGALGTSRVECAARRLHDLRPDLDIVSVPENASDSNVAGLVGQVDLVVDCAPLFKERFALNAEAVRQGKPMIDCAMFEFEATLTSILPGVTPCLRCLYPDDPVDWRREFPVFGAVAGSIGCLAAVEAIKIISGVGKPLFGRLLAMDLSSMAIRSLRIGRDPTCPVCGNLPKR
jgi:molybdopterin/thiamine biosynthesis adenylyltransferase